MKKFFAVLALALVTACGSVAPGAGEEAVLIYKPILFGHGGVDAKPVTTGRSFVALTTDNVKVNMQPNTYSVEFDDLMSSDGVPLDFHAMMRLQVTNSVRLIDKFGPNWFNANLQPEFAAQVRNAVKQHGMNETAISTVAVEQIDSTVSDGMTRFLAKIDIPIKLLAVTVGRANPPDAIKSQRIETATQEQRINTEHQRKLAEDSRKAAELSRADADNAYRQALNLSPDQFIRLEGIKMQHDACTRGNGCTFISGGNAVPLISNK